MAANRRILIAMAMLLVAIFASISVTFAWLSTNTQATAIFNLTVRETDDNLYIKVDTGIERKRTDDYSAKEIELADLNYTQSGGGWKLVTEEGRTASTGRYILQPYTLYTDNPQKSVYLDTAYSKVTSEQRLRMFGTTDKSYWLSEGINNEKIAQFYGTTDIEETNDRESKLIWRAGQEDETVYYYRSSGIYSTRAANAARIAVFSAYYDTIPTTAPATIWEPNENDGYDEVDDNGEYVYEHIASYYKNTVSNNKYVSVDRADLDNIIDYSVNENKPVVWQTMWRTVDRSEDDFYPKAPYRAEITVLLWLEGKDADCFNVIGNDTITSKLALILA